MAPSTPGGCVEPKRKQDLGIAGIAAGTSFNGSDVLVERRQVKTLGDLPNDSGRVIGIKALVERFATHLGLQAFGFVEARLGRVPRHGLELSHRRIEDEGFEFSAREKRGMILVRHESLFLSAR